MEQKLPDLGYAYDALEPFIDAKTMEIHYTKHHQTYINKLNEALRDYPKYSDMTSEKLLRNLNKVPAKIRLAVRNHGGGHVNHSFFWPTLKKGTQPNGELLKAINSQFSSFENFKKLFSESAAKVFGSGWTWLVLNNKELEIFNTSNQDSPLIFEKIPILGIDVWEHAYYLKYQNKRAEYIDAFFNIINWDKVNDNFIVAKKK